MKKIEEQILEEYAREYSIVSASYEIMGLMLNDRYVEERLRLFNVKDMYIYGGTYMAVQLYRVGKKYINIKGIIDKSGRIATEDQISVLIFEEFQKKYDNEKIIVTSIRYFQEIEKDLHAVVKSENIFGIGELMMGIV